MATKERRPLVQVIREASPRTRWILAASLVVVAIILWFIGPPLYHRFDSWYAVKSFRVSPSQKSASKVLKYLDEGRYSKEAGDAILGEVFAPVVHVRDEYHVGEPIAVSWEYPFDPRWESQGAETMFFLQTLHEPGHPKRSWQGLASSHSPPFSAVLNAWPGAPGVVSATLETHTVMYPSPNRYTEYIRLWDEPLYESHHVIPLSFNVIAASTHGIRLTSNSSIDNTMRRCVDYAFYDESTTALSGKVGFSLSRQWSPLATVFDVILVSDDGIECKVPLPGGWATPAHTTDSEWIFLAKVLPTYSNDFHGHVVLTPSPEKARLHPAIDEIWDGTLSFRVDWEGDKE